MIGGKKVDIQLTEKQLERLRRASDITEIQMLMAKYVEYMSKMRAADAYTLFAQNNENISIELAECGGYDGSAHVKAFLDAYDAYLSDPRDKRGWMELQTICNPTVLVSDDHSRAMGYWTILAPSSRPISKYTSSNTETCSLKYPAISSNSSMFVNRASKNAVAFFLASWSL